MLLSTEELFVLISCSLGDLWLLSDFLSGSAYRNESVTRDFSILFLITLFIFCDCKWTKQHFDHYIIWLPLCWPTGEERTGYTIYVFLSLWQVLLIVSERSDIPFGGIHGCESAPEEMNVLREHLGFWAWKGEGLILEWGEFPWWGHSHWSLVSRVIAYDKPICL